MYKIKFAVCGLLALWFADCTGYGRVNRWWGLFATLVFMKEMFAAIKEAE